MTARAIFLDRDGTLVQPRHYPSRPEELVLTDGVVPELRALQESGFRLVVITNQSGIARGLFTEADLARMHNDLMRDLRTRGVNLDGIYSCPHHPEGVVTAFAIDCNCRKPRPGLLLRAAAELRLDLAGSWFVGDILDDIEAGNRAGCRTVLVDLGTESSPRSPLRRPAHVAPDTASALAMIRFIEGTGPAVDLTYQPPAWPKARLHTTAESGSPPPIPRHSEHSSVISRESRNLSGRTDVKRFLDSLGTGCRDALKRPLLALPSRFLRD